MLLCLLLDNYSKLKQKKTKPEFLHEESNLYSVIVRPPLILLVVRGHIMLVLHLDKLDV